MRAYLKKQLESIEPHHIQFVKKVAESQEIAERTRMEEIKEKEKNLKHKEFLSRFMKDNKMVYYAG